MRTQIKGLIEQIVNSSSEELIGNKSLVDSLVELLCQVTDMDLHPQFFMDQDASITTQGKAVSMTTAAQCAEEYMRTQIFIRGVYQATQEQLQKKEVVHILYGGTGPFGLLLIPLLPLLKPERVRVRLLDIHRESLAALDKVISLLEVDNFIEKIECVDILQWQAEPGQKFDLIISETMKAMLDQEPQVSIFAHLSPYLIDGGSLVPQKIMIEAWLQTGDVNKHQMHLGEVFTLDHLSSLTLNGMTPPVIETVLPVPEYTDVKSDLKFTTTIQVYGDHWLNEKQCSLNLPRFLDHASPEPGGELHCQYLFGKYPTFKFEFKKKQMPSDQELVSHADKRVLGLPYLNRIWHKAQKRRAGNLAAGIHEQEWSLDVQVFDILGLGMEPAIQALYSGYTPQPWIDLIVERNSQGVSPQQEKMLNLCVMKFFQSEPELEPAASLEQGVAVSLQDIVPNVLSQDQVEFWERNGYLIIPEVLDKTECQQLLNEIGNFMGINMDNPESWYQVEGSQHNIMVPLFDSPTQHLIRQKKTIQDIFAQLWQTESVVPSTDRVSFNPPETKDWSFPGPGMHWDLKAFENPLPFATQGLIYLTDTEAHQGAFCCVPGFHKQFDGWLSTVPEGADPQLQDWSQFNVTPIAASAGDLIIWHQALPHGSSPNTAKYPRVVQYLNMTPVKAAMV